MCRLSLSLNFGLSEDYMQLNQPNLKQFIVYKEAFKKTAKYDNFFNHIAHL